MPLLVAVLTEEILKINDDTRGDFVGFPMVLDPTGLVDVPATNDLVATNWSNAAGIYLAGISVPPGAVAAVPAAVAAFKSAMVALLTVPQGGIAALAAGWTAAAVAIAGASPPVAVPPPAPLLPLLAGALAPFLIGAPDPALPAAAKANAIQTWIATGLWGPPPSPPASPWA